MPAGDVLCVGFHADLTLANETNPEIVVQRSPVASRRLVRLSIVRQWDANAGSGPPIPSASGRVWTIIIVSGPLSGGQIKICTRYVGS